MTTDLALTIIAACYVVNTLGTWLVSQPSRERSDRLANARMQQLLDLDTRRELEHAAWAGKAKEPK